MPNSVNHHPYRMLNQSIIPGAPIPVKTPIFPTAANRPSNATPDGMHQHKIVS
jgi:hypothetical protein